MPRPVVYRAIKRRRMRELGIDASEAGHVNPGWERRDRDEPRETLTLPPKSPKDRR